MKEHFRYLQNTIVNDALADKKMAFISGPRQVGKTTMAKSILRNVNQSQHYYSWDDDEFRKIWKTSPKTIFDLTTEDTCLVFDEIHKDRKWKNTLKGLYDLYSDTFKLIITESARLDFYRKSGDSLQGRYIPYRLHPLSIAESDSIPAPPTTEWNFTTNQPYQLNDLLILGGFPEPFYSQSENKARRWRRLYRERMIQQDVRDVREVKDLQQIETLALLLPDRVGSSLSYKSLTEDLQCSFDTVRSWIGILETLYFCYCIRPFSKRITYSIKKEPKLYLFDWAAVSDDGARLENLVASHLLKACHAWTDCAYGEYDLYYIRDKQKREVDFLITESNQPHTLIEVKSTQSTPTAGLEYYTKLLNPKFSFQLVRSKKQERARTMSTPKISVIEVGRFLSALP